MAPAVPAYPSYQAIRIQAGSLQVGIDFNLGLQNWTSTWKWGLLLPALLEVPIGMSVATAKHPPTVRNRVILLKARIALACAIKESPQYIECNTAVLRGYFVVSHNQNTWGIHPSATLLLYHPQVRLEAVNTGGFHWIFSGWITLRALSLAFSRCCTNRSGTTILCSPL